MNRTQLRTAKTLSVLLFLAWTTACEPMPDPQRPGYPGVGDAVSSKDVNGLGLPDAPFAAPEGLAVVGDFLVVANSAYGYDERGNLTFGTGFVTVVDRRDRRVAHRIPMPVKNPQIVVESGERVWVLCSGQTTFDGTQVTPVTDGALVGIRVDQLLTAQTPDVVIPIPLDPTRPLMGYPSSLTIAGGRAWIGSGTAAAIFVADLKTSTLVRGPSDPVMLGDADVQDTMVLGTGPVGYLLAASFNRDLIWMLDATTGNPVSGTPFEVGVAGAMDGVLALAWRDGGVPNVFVLLGMASQVDAVTLNNGAPRVVREFIKTGSLPNAMALDGDRLLVLSSGANNVRGFDAGTGNALPFRAVCPFASNPYAMAVGEVEGRHELYVSGLRANAVYVFDAGTGINPGTALQEIR